jgi:putative flippase GtrA
VPLNHRQAIKLSKYLRRSYVEKSLSRCIESGKNMNIIEFQFARETYRQIFNYALIGLLVNSISYSIYFLFAYLSGSHKMTMTVLYLLGASIGFLANRHFTFKHDGGIGVTGIRYILAQIMGYLLNLALLLLFVDWLDFPHQIVQAIAIVVVAVFLFVMLRLFVFTPSLTVNGVVR